MKSKIKLSFNFKSATDWLTIAGVLYLVGQYVAQSFGFDWNADLQQVMSSVNILISALVTMGLLKNTEPTDLDKQIIGLVNKGESTSAKK